MEGSEVGRGAAHAYRLARVLLMISRNSGLMDAPPTRKPGRDG
jgi:hypothetical protein